MGGTPIKFLARSPYRWVRNQSHSMRTAMKNTKKMALALVTTGALLLASVGASSASNITTTAGVVAGPFDVMSAPTAASLGPAGGVPLDGVNDLQLLGNLGATKVRDATGAGQGWHVEMSGTLFHF